MVDQQYRNGPIIVFFCFLPHTQVDGSLAKTLMLHVVNINRRVYNYNNVIIANAYM